MYRILIIISMVVSFPVHASERLLVFAAASQREAMEEVGRRFENKCQCEITFSLAASSTLARQVDAGAAADVMISANQAWVDWLEIRGQTQSGSRAIIAGNRLVVASAARTRDSFNILMRGRFSMADPVSVPAGIYAREALGSMGIWDRVRENAVYSENVRVALASVARGDLLSGIVYQSDLQLAPELHAHFVFPEETHQPIHYVAVATSEAALAIRFIGFLQGAEAQEIFERFGFLPLSATKQE